MSLDPSIRTNRAVKIAPLLYDTMVTVMTVAKAILIRRRSGAASSRLIQTFLREGKKASLYACLGLTTYRRCFLLHPHFHCEPCQSFISIHYDSLLTISFRSTVSSTSSEYLKSCAQTQADAAMIRPRQTISAICIPLSVMLAPVLACRLILDLRERGSETVAQSTGTMAFTAGPTASQKSSPGSPFSGFGFGGIRSSNSRVIMRPQGVVLSTMGTIPGDGMASASGLELDNLEELEVAKNSDLESAFHASDDLQVRSAVSGIRIDVEKTTM